jgi:hypothetical protein
MTRLLPPLVALALATGCTTPVPAPAKAEQRQVYQTIANALPRAHFGWGDAPGMIEMTASARAEGKPPELPQLKATERGFTLNLHVYRPRQVWIPYPAVAACSVEWPAVPNVFLVPLLVVPFQSARATIVLDTSVLEGFHAALESDLKRLEQISREIGLGGPWSHAQHVRAKVADDAAIHGEGKLAIHFDYGVGWFAWWPSGGEAERVAEALAWAGAHPDAPALEPKPEEAPQPGDAPDEGS